MDFLFDFVDCHEFADANSRNDGVGRIWIASCESMIRLAMTDYF